MVRAALLLLLLFLVLLRDGACSEKVCDYQDILDHLNLTVNSGAFRLTRPVLDHRRPTVVKLNILLYAILAVVEKTQMFIPFIWTTVDWTDERIKWDPAHFCGITDFSVPQEILWKPDLFIYEMIEKDDSPRNPFMRVHHDGTVSKEDTLRVVCTCKIDVHKFPFDTQSCSVSISSASYTVKELRLVPDSNSSRATHFSREVMQTQSEWEFLQLTVGDHNVSYQNKHWDQVFYTFTVRRRPLLHVINFLLPILFFLSLDLASFFIADHRGEKLGFKVTVLLAISVLLLILNDILPAMSDETPLIATYCIVIFALMLLSLLETILVTYLMEKDSRNTTSKRDKPGRVKTDPSDGDDKRLTFCSCICKSSGGEKQLELSVAEEVDAAGAGSEECRVLLSILEELKGLQTTLNLHLSCRVEGGRCARWAARINSAFFCFYICTVSLFLPLIFLQWKT